MPQFGAENNAKMQKCHFCLDRLDKNQKPACVDSCPMRALDAGPLDKLRGLYGDVWEAEGLLFDKKVKPSIIFKPKRETKGLALKKVQIAPYPDN